MIFTVHQYLAGYGMDPIDDPIIARITKKAGVTDTTLLSPKLEILCDCLRYAALKLPDIKQAMLESGIHKNQTVGEQGETYDIVMDAAVETVFTDVREIWQLNKRDVTELRAFTTFNRPVPKPYRTGNEPNDSMEMRIKHALEWKFPENDLKNSNDQTIIAAELGMSTLTINQLLNGTCSDTETVVAFCDAIGISDKWVIFGQIPDQHKPTITMKELIKAYIEDFAYPAEEPWILAAYFGMNEILQTTMDDAINNRANSKNIRLLCYTDAKKKLYDIIGDGAKNPKLHGHKPYDIYYGAMRHALNLVTHD